MGTTTLSIMTFSTTTPSIKCLFVTLSINDIQHSYILLSVLMLSVIMLSVTMASAILLGVILISVIRLIVIC